MTTDDYRASLPWWERRSPVIVLAIAWTMGGGWKLVPETAAVSMSPPWGIFSSPVVVYLIHWMALAFMSTVIDIQRRGDYDRGVEAGMTDLLCDAEQRRPAVPTGERLN